jgi:hypothetical protein
MSDVMKNMENLASIVKPRVVVISSCESLLGRAVEYLTSDEKEWMILRAFESRNLAELVQKVEQANPNIVIISQVERDFDEQFSMQLIKACPELQKVIFVILSENLMEVYCRQRIQVNSTQDLFSVVENQFSKL